MTRTLVLGLGNPLMGDDGAGVVALNRLRDDWQVPEEVDLVDGGTWGMNLLPLLESHDRVILLDAIHTGSRPGSLILLRREDLPRYFAHKLSPHQLDLREVLALAELRDALPETLIAIGVEPENVELNAMLSPRVSSAIRRMVALTLDQLEWLGHHCERLEPVCA
jgi:hydrogenase maturation protease